MAAEPRPANAAAALEVADPALARDAVAGEALLRAPRWRPLLAGDEELGFGEVVVGLDGKATVERDLPRPLSEAIER